MCGARGGGGRGLYPPNLDNHMWLYASLETLVRISLEKLLGPWGPIPSQGWSVRPSLKYVDD